MAISTFNKVKPLVVRFWPELVFFGLAVVMLWQMLLPGYVLALDMVWTPHVYVQATHDGYWYQSPWQVLLWALHLALPVWLIQKVVLLGTLVLIAECAYRCLPVPGGKVPRVTAALLYLVNPFVYARFLAGHQLILVSYGLLPVVLWLAMRALRSRRQRDVLYLGIVVALVGTVAPHMMVIALAGAIIMAAVWFAAQERIPWRFIGRAAVVLVATVVVLSSYWVVPLLLQRQRLDQRFDRADLEAFSAASRPGFPVALDLVWLGGYWGERMQWSLQYRWPQDLAAARVAEVIVLGAVAYGVLQARRSGMRRRTLAGFGTIAAIAYTLGAGVSLPVLGTMNRELFEHVPFWSGFRDSQKWIGLLALPIATFFGVAVSVVWARFQKSAQRFALFGGVITVVLVACYPMLFGMSGRFHAFWYPDGWQNTKRIVDGAPPGSRALFLPWHRYFVNRLAGRTDFPAYFYYGPRAITNRSLELAGIGDSETDPGYRKLDTLLTDADTSASEAIRELQSQGVSHVVWFRDLDGFDPLTYRFLRDKGFQIVYEDQDVRVFAVPDDIP